MDNLQKFNKIFDSFILKNVLFYNVATRLVRSQILKQRGSVLFSPAYLPVSTQSPYSYNPFIQSFLSNQRFLRLSQSQYSFKPKSFPYTYKSLCSNSFHNNLLLFLLYINDLPSSVKQSNLSYLLMTLIYL